ncbi:hypothetical protein PENANT_c001G04118 [Penicillium antarcticum]|uniref:Uncharacterized protein n=1 Tax=Penicillium antarcticum TaxID=416450 RepID=A0A1V6QN73_9EURO|nr:uncharacterized protein N7508_010331 [Penicillium antarcticum]KAJ5295510.1 hypothetical protein N7508_010331 [Penicillium antarcticum]OQD90689.1 hypothetical protein PENANT_c001G04118 [Penicillium antarcticum]
MLLKRLQSSGIGLYNGVTRSHFRVCARCLSTTQKLSKAEDQTKSKQEQEQSNTSTDSPSSEDKERHPVPRKSKTVSEADAELRERLERMSGEGGASGIEYEDGKPNAMKRGVRNNMFRLI